jgi:hypothetical protein
MPTYETTKLNSMTLVVNVTLRKDEKHFDIFSSPDHHWDNPKCHRELLKEHMDEALGVGAAIVLPGDTFCMMQGKYDPRRNKSDIRPEHNKANYIDTVISDAADWYKPYRESIVCIGTGNHESAILKSLETNILERFGGELGGGVPVMGYHGWIIFRVHVEGIEGARANFKYYFNHGTGGGGAVTRGQIEFSRLMMCVEGADAISTGHVHERNLSEVMVHYFDENSAAYTPKIRSILLVRSSTYKQEYVEHGFHIEKGRPPKPLGGTFIRLHLSRDKKGSWILTAEPRFKGTKAIDLAH